MTKAQQKEMSDRIKERRSALGFTQEQFAETVGLSYGSYTKIENAFQKPALDTLIKIAQRLDLSLDYLVFGTEERAPNTAMDTDILRGLLEYADSEKVRHTSELLARIAKLKDK